MRVREGLLLSSGEVRAKRVLQKFCQGKQLVLYKEVPVKQVLEIARTQLEPREQNYYMTSSFDFVVCESTPPERPLFGVEFDGSQHKTDPIQIERDAIKNRLCEKAGFPLIRIDWEGTQRGHKKSLLEFLLEAYYAEDSLRMLASKSPPNVELAAETSAEISNGITVTRRFRTKGTK